MVRASLLAISLLLLAACRSPEQKFQKELSGAVSANGTLQLMAQAWLGNRVPRAFARFAVRSTSDDLEKQATKLARSGFPAAKKLEREVGAVHDAADSLLRGIEKNDRAEVVRAHSQFVAASDRLERLQQREEASTH